MDSEERVLSVRPNFNPTLVQLEYSDSGFTVTDSGSFQSHIGAIRIAVITADQLNREYFNPTLVQLEYTSRTIRSSESIISIPHWCN